MPETASVSAASEHLQGHLGHLVPDQTSAFEAFKTRCADRGLLGDVTSNAGDDIMSGIYDDATLLRFLRARKFIVDDAYEQYSAMRSWRETNQILSLYDNIEVEEFEETRKIYTHWIGRRDKYGVPICLFVVGNLTPSMMSAYSSSNAASTTQRAAATMHSGTSTAVDPPAILRLGCTYDHLTRFLLPLVSAVPGRPNPETPVTQTNCIVDVSGLSLRDFWTLRTHLQAASTMATSHYPETLGRTYIIGAPFFFPTIWRWLKGWFDPITVSKIFIVPAGEILSTLSLAIDPTNIPRRYGGQLDYEFGMLPNLDPEIVRMLDWLAPDNTKIESGTGGQQEGQAGKELPIGPMRWSIGEDGVRTAVAVGTVDGKERRVEVARMKT